MAPSIEAVLEPPSPVHPFGTDDLGRDVLSRVIYGRWISLEGGLAAVGLAAVVGTSCGLLAAFSGGAWDTLVMRGTDILLAFPGILLAIAIVATLGPNLTNVVIAVGIGVIPVYARTVRGSTALRAPDGVRGGGPRGRRHDQPASLAPRAVRNITAPILVLTTLGSGSTF